MKSIMRNDIIDNTEIRALSADDDLTAVARLIFSSDDYIYPYLFDNDLPTAEKVLVNMILGDTLYNYKNIRVAVCSDQIIAMMISKRVPIVLDHESILDCFVRASVPVGTILPIWIIIGKECCLIRGFRLFPMILKGLFAKIPITSRIKR